MNHFLRILLIVSFSLSVYAQSTWSPGTNSTLVRRYRSMVRQALINSDNLGDECNTCAIANGEEMQDRGCEATYDRLYSKEPVDMRVMFGYIDYRGVAGSTEVRARTEDRYMAAAMIAKLTAKGVDSQGRDRCPPSRNDCGFTRSEDDQMVLTKTIVGPDGADHKVRVTIAHSSISDNDDHNNPQVKDDGSHETLRDEQRALTKQNEEMWEDGLQNADVMIYSGHMRSGGGPSFGPPRMLKNGHVNYASYRSNAKVNRVSAVDRMDQVLAKTDTPAQFIGLLACDSERFASSVRSYAPRSGVALVGPHERSEAAFEQAALAIDGLLNFRCEADFHKLINSCKSVAGQQMSQINDTQFFKPGRYDEQSSRASDRINSTSGVDPNDPNLTSARRSNIPKRTDGDESGNTTGVTDQVSLRSPTQGSPVAKESIQRSRRNDGDAPPAAVTSRPAPSRPVQPAASSDIELGGIY